MNQSEPASLWSGVFSSFAEARGDRAVFEADHWVGRQVASLAQAVAAAKDPSPISAGSRTADYILYPVAAALSATRRPVRILDFGGGAASAFAPLLAGLGDANAFDLTVIENQELVRQVRPVLPAGAPARMCATMEEVQGPFDIVHLGSSLHYVEHWTALLARLCAFRPEHVILVDLPAGRPPASFVTLQSYYGRSIPVWFFRLDDLTRAMDLHGYRLTFRARFQGAYRREGDAPPQAALPPAYRLDAFCQLLFSRK
jgi:putative methyltransferase (TIGR04325 family)